MDAALEAARKNHDDILTQAYAESILDFIADYEKEDNEEWANGYREELAKYDALDPGAKARVDLNN